MGRVVIAEIVDNELMFDGMTNVAIGAAVLAGRRVDFHKAIVIRMLDPASTGTAMVTLRANRAVTSIGT